MELTCKVMRTKAETGPGSLWDQAPFCSSHLSSPSSLSHPDFSLSLVQKLEYGKHTASTFMFPQQVQIPERNILTGLAFSGPWSYQLWPGGWGHVGLSHLFRGCLFSAHFMSDSWCWRHSTKNPSLFKKEQ